MDKENLDDALAISIAITGHRDIREEDHQRIIQDFDDLIFPLLDKYKHLKIRLISGLATGTDQLLINRGLQLQKEGKPIEVLGVLPMPKSEYLNDFNDDEKIVFEQFLTDLDQNGHRVVELSNEEVRNDCYRNLAQYLTNKADIIVAVWDGVNNQKVGGTSDVVMLGILPILSVIEPQMKKDPVQQSLNTNATFYGLESTIVYVIPVRRAGSEQSEPNFNNAGFWHSSKWYVDEVQPGRFDTEDWLSNIQELRFVELNVLSKEIMDDTPSDNSKLKHTPLKEYQNEDFNTLKKRFQQIDSLANKFQKKVNNFHWFLVWTTFFLALSFLTYAKLFPEIWGFLLAYIVVFVFGVFRFRCLKPNLLKTRRAIYRLASESLRIEFFAQAAGLKGEVGTMSMAKKLNTYGMEEVEVIRSIIQQSTMLANVKTEIVDKKVIIDDWLERQKLFYKEKSEELHKKHMTLHKLFTMTIWAPIVIAIGLLLYLLYVFLTQDAGTQNTTETLVKSSFQLATGFKFKSIPIFLIGIIPVIGALIELHFNYAAVKELHHQYSTSQKYIENAIRVLSKASEREHYIAMLKIVSAELSSEQTRWAVTTKQRVMELPTGG